ncbi:molybdate ABC transporter substrate-binding protein [Saccharomonospora cyanea]|uniref:Molybdenum ABC transporter, periplasmic molybdate-binding protein n=1 Tax=Saccharomonospora cyanea NA-134 TaxID=882082 RepID=H5XQ58_9PSEU|nr:molybdate ABC transporter substrate-binding protein [Saccharomonospora cyanea]EHR63324.1 molybdenum ABC transporter, periplasmic molybdate-binding protein [Saccharomonospora cyanea NA-134]
MRRRSMLSAAMAALLVATSATACGGGGGQRVLTVFAAASLTEVFTDLERRFEQTHDGIDVRLNLAGSSRLAQQIVEGAPADVFASADTEPMARLEKDGLLDGPATPFATNTLTIAVPRGNPAGITGLADLADPGVTVVVCAPAVPCGAAAKRVQRLAGVTLRPASEEADVRSVLTKVEVGEADAGLVYATDVHHTAASGRVEAVAFPEAAEVVNTYPVAVPADAAEAASARRFVDLVLSEEGRRSLREAGFGLPR